MKFNYNTFTAAYHQLRQTPASEQAVVDFCVGKCGLELLDIGSSKYVFKAGDACLKIAKNGDLSESISILQCSFSECFPKLLAYDQIDQSSAIYELCEVCTGKDITDAFCLDPILFERTMNLLAHNRKKFVCQMKNSVPRCNEIFDLLDPTIAVLDFGLEDVKRIKAFISNVFGGKSTQFKMLQQLLEVKSTYSYSWLDDIRPQNFGKTIRKK